MKIPVTNTTKMPIYVGASMIQPGETRHFEEADVPDYLRPPKAAEPEAPAAGDPLAELLTNGVKKIEERFGDLTDDQLQTLGAMESRTESPRSTLLKAIEEEQINRAIAAEEAAKKGG
jgi:hypothetical protein